MRERAADVLKGRRQVDDASYLAHMVLKLLGDYEQAVNNLSAVQTRCTDLLVNQQTLKSAIDRIAAADDESRMAAIEDASMVARGIQ